MPHYAENSNCGCLDRLIPDGWDGLARLLGGVRRSHVVAICVAVDFVGMNLVILQVIELFFDFLASLSTYQVIHSHLRPCHRIIHS